MNLDWIILCAGFVVGLGHFSSENSAFHIFVQLSIGFLWLYSVALIYATIFASSMVFPKIKSNERITGTININTQQSIFYVLLAALISYVLWIDGYFITSAFLIICTGMSQIWFRYLKQCISEEKIVNFGKFLLNK